MARETTKDEAATTSNWCSASEVSTDRTCGVCGVQATPQTIARWFIDEEPSGDRCDLHHPYNGNAEGWAPGWTGCTINGVIYAYHIPCGHPFIVPQEHDCRGGA